MQVNGAFPGNGSFQGCPTLRQCAPEMMKLEEALVLEVSEKPIAVPLEFAIVTYPCRTFGVAWSSSDGLSAQVTPIPIPIPRTKVTSGINNRSNHTTPEILLMGTSLILPGNAQFKPIFLNMEPFSLI